jgi:hypothetical protein
MGKKYGIIRYVMTKPENVLYGWRIRYIDVILEVSAVLMLGNMIRL